MAESDEVMSTSLNGSIYQAIGGEPALTAVVEDFYQRVLGDGALCGFFTETDIARLKRRQVEFFAAALDGPRGYTGASMRRAHQGLGIRQEHFDLVAGHLIAALAAAGVPPETIGQIMETVAPLAKEIVSGG
jgi:hemoglobin